MEEKQLEMDINVFIRQDDHPAYDREEVEVHLQFPLGDVFESFPKEGNFFGLENKKLEEITLVESDDRYAITGVYNGSSQYEVSSPINDNDPIEIRELVREQNTPGRKVYRILWERTSPKAEAMDDLAGAMSGDEQ